MDLAVDRAAHVDPTDVAILFAPQVVPLLDVFRTLRRLEDAYDVAALGLVEERLAIAMSARAAKGVVSDAILLGFGVRRESPVALAYAAPGSRAGTLDEYRVLAIIAGAYWRDIQLAYDAAAALQIAEPRPLIALACDIARRLDRSGIALAVPDRRLLASAPAADRPCGVLVSRALRPVGDLHNA